MIRVLMVDDELHVRQAIRRMVDWQQMGMEVKEADNGEAALALAGSYHPHLVIMDMQMPLMDGVSLMDRMSDGACEFIVVSGHDDFRYMKKAIVHKAIDYLLKPISRKDINDALLKAVSAIVAKSGSDRKAKVEERLKNVLWQEPQLRVAEHLTAITAADPQGWQAIKLTVCYITDFREKALKRYNGDEQLLKYRVEQELLRLFGDTEGLYIVPGIGGRADPLIVRKADSPAGRSSSSSWLQRQLAEAVGVQALFMESPAELSLSSLRQAYVASRSAFLERSWRQPSLPVPALKPSEDRKMDDGRGPAAFKRIQHELCRLLYQENSNQVRDKIREWISLLERMPELSISQAYGRFAQMRHAMHHGLDPSELANSLRPVLSQVTSDEFLEFGLQPDSLEAYLVQEAERIQVYIRDRTPGKGVEQIHRFLQEHYSQPYSLDRLASRFHLSRSYLCKAFKEKYGCTITDYMTKLRMEQARSYMIEQGYLVQQAAEAVGMTDFSYFSKRYKKHFGYPPSNEAR